MPRQPILSVLGHVDSGKTTLLDRIRESRIVEGEEGGITQMIGATEIPLETIEDVCGDLLNQLDTDITIPGMLFIDTPGHAAFSSLRKRGGSISDIAIVVVDVQNGIQPQTEEALKILQDTNTPFIIALNKIDTLPGWRSEHNLFTKNLQEQTDKVQSKLDEEIYSLMGDLHDQTGVTAERFDRVDNFQKKAAIVPISAMTGEGLPELLMTLTGLSQNYLSDQLEVEEDSTGKGTVLEVTKEKGLGTTLDIIHYDGQIKKDDTLVYGTQDGVKTTDIRALLQPRPLQEIRLDKQYSQVDKINPASGVKISGKDLEGAIAGAPVRTTQENIEEVKEEVHDELETMAFETQNEGILVKADSLGSLEALMREIEDIPVQEAKVGAVKKNDVVKVENEEPENRAIFAFNVEATEQAEDMIEDKGIELFQNQVIYKIVEDYNEWREILEKKQQEQALEQIPRPGKIQLMPQHIFNQAKPAVIGAKVKKGVIKPDTALMNKQGDKVGRLKAIQEQNESIDKASKGAEVAVSISGATVGRTFEDDEVLFTDLTGKQYRQLQHLDEHLSTGEKQVLEEIVDIKDSKDPHWKIG
jgi:translation initiation factor 5B